MNEPVNAPIERPWYIGLLLGTAGWFAGIFVLIFVFMLFKPDSGTGAFVMAAVLLASAWGLYRVDPDGSFVSQLALALSIAGQFALFYGVYSTLFKHGDSITGMALVGLVMQVGLVALMPNSLHRAMSTLFACIAWALLVRFGLWDDFSFNRMDRSKTPPTLIMMVAAWLVAWIPVGVTLYGAVFKGWLQRPVIVGLILGLAFATLVSYPLDAFRWFDGVARHTSLSVWPLFSAIASVIAIAAAFAIHSRGLMALCIVAAVLHVSHFYYQMDTSLLIKSIVMIGLGTALLVGARRWK